MLSLVTEETYIPVYSLEQTSRSGSRHFEIAQASGLTGHQKHLFFVPHRKDFYLLVLVRRGSSRHWVDMVPYTTKPGTLYFSSPQQVFLKEESGPFEATSICFTPEFLDMEEAGLAAQLPIIQNRQGGHELLLSAADVAFIEDISQKLLAEYQHSHGGWRNSMLLAYLRVLLIHLSAICADGLKNQGGIKLSGSPRITYG